MCKGLSQRYSRMFTHDDWNVPKCKWKPCFQVEVKEGKSVKKKTLNKHTITFNKCIRQNIIYIKISLKILELCPKHVTTISLCRWRDDIQMKRLTVSGARWDEDSDVCWRPGPKWRPSCPQRSPTVRLLQRPSQWVHLSSTQWVIQFLFRCSVPPPTASCGHQCGHVHVFIFSFPRLFFYWIMQIIIIWYYTYFINKRTLDIN